MYNIQVTNVNRALDEGLHLLLEVGEREESRNGTVVVAPCPVTTTYLKPTQRVLFSPMRDANPFFHLFEALWMLAGRNDLGWPLYFNKRFGAYSDDGRKVYGAYGHRWRYWFGFDQLAEIAGELTCNSNSRRCVLAMWDGNRDGDGFWVDSDLRIATRFQGKDVPCNTHAYFDARHGKLNMTVCCRSNDILWGAYGANAVHFSILLEFMAAWIGLPVGVYRQMSNNYHAYTDVVPIDRFEDLAHDAATHDLYKGPYEDVPGMTHPLVTKSALKFLEELQVFMEDPLKDHPYTEPFLREVAQPMFAAWKVRKEHRGTGELETSYIAAMDWRMACQQWIGRREAQKGVCA